MRAAGWSLFDTPVGRCGLAWSAAGIASLLLPGSDDAATRGVLARRFPAAHEDVLPADVRALVDRIVALLQGARDDLADLPLDLGGVPGFDARVYAQARRIPPGQTRTYGEVAAALGEPGAARAVGQALGANRFAIVVPCHRVLAAGGKAGGFSAPGGLKTKLALLEIERARLGGAPGLFD
jgi:methylated-DNA-[protein]-cysteine S-methyltransferase